MLISATQNTLFQLIKVLNSLDKNHYTQVCAVLSNATIGEHTRHVIELFECLINNYKSGIVSYDKRKRDRNLEINLDNACQRIQEIIDSVQLPNKPISIHQTSENEILIIDTNYHRELLYNLEHCIHHQALIKVALLEFGYNSIDEEFGVARSTLEYRKQCAR